MPQMNMGGMFIFGKSMVRPMGAVRVPPQAVSEYDIAAEGRVYLFTGSKVTGGFCVTRKGLLGPSKLGHLLEENPPLRQYELAPGAFLRYKGRWYAWAPITPQGELHLPNAALDFLNLEPGMELLCIRSSDIAFTLGAKGPLLERAERYEGVIETF